MSPLVGRLDRSAYELDVDEAFAATALNPRLWIPYYLPHWSSREQSAARYDVGGGGLRLRIDADQPPADPVNTGEMRVSSLQTGVFAGPVGSGIGQHRVRDGLVVREAQDDRALYTPQYGLFELLASALDDPANMVALWMIGYEDEPSRSAEICICEIFGSDVRPASARIGMGVRPFADPVIRDDFEQVEVAIDARRPHWYAAEWTPEQVRFYVDEELVKVVEQSPAYPMQFMLNVYEFRDGPTLPSPLDRYPKVFEVQRFRAWVRTRAAR